MKAFRILTYLGTVHSYFQSQSKTVLGLLFFIINTSYYNLIYNTFFFIQCHLYLLVQMSFFLPSVLFRQADMADGIIHIESICIK